MKAKIKPFKKIEDYRELQESDSAKSRGTMWGKRVLDSLSRYGHYIRGKILDVGCNDGLGIETLMNKGFETEGIDIANEKLKIAYQHNLKVHFAYQEKMPFKDKSFDTIFASHVLEHSFDTKKAVKEYARVAKRAIIIVPIEPNKMSQGHTSRFKTSQELIDLFKGKGDIIFKEKLNRLQPEYTIIVDFK